jgi:biotin carboxylase
MHTPSLSQGTILFLGTRELPLERVAEIQVAREMGHEVIMVSDRPEVYQSYGFTHNFQAPLGNYEQAIPIITDYLQTHKLPISGVISWQDREEELAAHLTKHLGLPSCSLEANQKARNKAMTRQMLESLGGHYNPRYEFVYDAESFTQALEKLGKNGMLKLAGNSGGRGIASISEQDDPKSVWDKFIAANDPSQGEMYAFYRDRIILEEKLTGSEHSVSGVVVDGEVIIFAITDKRIDLATQLQYQNLTPSRLSVDRQQEIKKMATDVIRATGINWRGFHLDFMVTDQGLKILELGARLGGECINSHLISLASSSLHPYQVIMDVIQGQSTLTQTDYSQSFSRQAASRVIAPPAKGRITHISGLEKLCTSPYTRDFVQLKGIGDLVIPPTEAYEQYKIAYLIAESGLEEDLNTILDEMVADLKIEVEPI